MGYPIHHHAIESPTCPLSIVVAWQNPVPVNLNTLPAPCLLSKQAVAEKTHPQADSTLLSFMSLKVRWTLNSACLPPPPYQVSLLPSLSFPSVLNIAPQVHPPAPTSDRDLHPMLHMSGRGCPLPGEPGLDVAFRYFSPRETNQLVSVSFFPAHTTAGSLSMLNPNTTVLETALFPSTVLILRALVSFKKLR